MISWIDIFCPLKMTENLTIMVMKKVLLFNNFTPKLMKNCFFFLQHHWREGNLPSTSKCAYCKKTCWSSECLTGMRISGNINPNKYI